MDYIETDFNKVINGKIDLNNKFDDEKLYNLMYKICEILLSMNKENMNHFL